MSLLQKASIITTPTAYAEDYLYSIKPAYSLGSELVTNGNFATDSNWTKTSGAVISNGVATITVTGGGFQSVAQSISLSNTKKYRLTAVVNGTSGKAVTFVDNSANNGGLTTSNGVITFNGQDQNVDITWTANTNSSEIEIIRNGSGDFSFTVDSVSVKEITDADFDFDRNTIGTRINEDYLIEDVPYNAINFSEDFTQWSLNGDSVVLQDETYLGRPIYKLTEASSSTLGVHQTRTRNMVGSPYTISLIAKKDTSSFIRLRFGNPINKNVDFNLDTGVVTSESSGVTGAIQNIGNGFYQLSSVLASLTHATISYAIYSSNGSIFITSAQMVKGDKLKDYLKTTDRLDIPRIDYTNGEPSILLEPQRQNEVTYSNDYTDSSWSHPSLTVTSNQAISPEGIQNADKLVINNGTFPINGGLYVSRTSTANQDVSFSIFAKAGQFRYGTIAYGSNSANGFHFDLEDGVILSTFTSTFNYTNIGYEMIAYPNGWYRLVVSTTELQQGAGRFIGIRPHNTIPTSTNNNYNSTGDGSSGIFVYGAQIEVGSYATSLIHTSGSAVTRSADAANNAGNSDLINSTEGVLYAEVAASANDGTNRAISISDGTTSNVVRFYYSTTDNRIVGNVKSGGSTVFNFNNVLINATDFIKLAIYYKVNDFKMYVNGTQVSSDTSGAAPTGLKELAFDNGAGNDDFYGEAQMVAVFKEALTDTELEKLTGYNNHELYMNYYNRLSYLGLVEEYNVESDINNYIL